MKNRIDQKFEELRRRKKKAFIAFITAGDPDLATTKDLVLAFDKSGVDIVELGIPFSDPLADGPTIQASSQRALRKNVNIEKILAAVKDIRRQSSVPIVLLTYYNPIFHFGEERFIQKAKDSGVDGLVIPDLPPEEAGQLIALARKNSISTVFLVAPTTRPERIKKITHACSGFVYYVSLTGVTGARTALPKSLITQVRKIKQTTGKPVCVGFGISTPEQVKVVGRIADGVIVGSSIVSQVAKYKSRDQIVKNVTAYVRRLQNAIR